VCKCVTIYFTRRAPQHSVGPIGQFPGMMPAKGGIPRNGSNWLQQPFSAWGDDEGRDGASERLDKAVCQMGVTEGSRQGLPHEFGDGAAMHAARTDAQAMSRRCSVTSEDVETLGSRCSVVVRCFEGTSAWDSIVRAAVGSPVHLDIVLAKDGSAGAKFCFSSYMNHKFEMSMMDRCMVHNPSVSNIALEVSDEELERCTKFLTALDGKAAYSYFDAMVLVPLAPKVRDLSSTVYACHCFPHPV
jgi:hypothetical protein